MECLFFQQAFQLFIAETPGARQGQICSMLYIGYLNLKIKTKIKAGGQV